MNLQLDPSLLYFIPIFPIIFGVHLMLRCYLYPLTVPSPPRSSRLSTVSYIRYELLAWNNDETTHIESFRGETITVDRIVLFAPILRENKVK